MRKTMTTLPLKFAWLRKAERLETALGALASIAIVGAIYEFHHVRTAADIKREEAAAAAGKQQQAREITILNLAERCERTDSVTYECLRAEHDADQILEDAKADE